MRRLKGLFNRANVTQRELSIMRGICSAIQGKNLNVKKDAFCKGLLHAESCRLTFVKNSLTSCS